MLRFSTRSLPIARANWGKGEPCRELFLKTILAGGCIYRVSPVGV